MFMNLSGNYERIHKCCKCCRIHYADYIIDESALLATLIKSKDGILADDEFNTILDSHTKFCLRANHHLFEYDDLAREIIKKDKNKNLARKIYKIAESICRNGMDYSFLAISIYRTLKDKKWCEELYVKAQNNIKDGLCYVNMINFIEIKTIDKDEAKKFLEYDLVNTEYIDEFYYTMAVELKSLKEYDGVATEFYIKSISKTTHPYFIDYAHVFISDQNKLDEVYKKMIENMNQPYALDNVVKYIAKYSNHKILRNAIEKAIKVADSCQNFVDIAKIAISRLKDKEFARNILNIALKRAKTSDDFSCIAQNIAYKFKDRIWARDIFKIALAKADKIYEIIDIAESILEYLHDKEWVKEIYYSSGNKQSDFTKANDKSYFLNTRPAVARGFIKNFDDKEKAKEIYALELEKPNDIHHFTNILLSAIEDFDLQTWQTIIHKYIPRIAKKSSDYAWLGYSIIKNTGDAQFAKPFYEKAVNMIQYDYNTNFTIESIYEDLKDTKLLNKACKKLLKQANAPYLKLAIWLSEGEGDINLAKQCILKALKICKKYSEILNITNVVLVSLKDKDWAIKIATDEQYINL